MKMSTKKMHTRINIFNVDKDIFYMQRFKVYKNILKLYDIHYLKVQSEVILIPKERVKPKQKSRKEYKVFFQIREEIVRYGQWTRANI